MQACVLDQKEVTSLEEATILLAKQSAYIDHLKKMLASTAASEEKLRGLLLETAQ